MATHLSLFSKYREFEIALNIKICFYFLKFANIRLMFVYNNQFINFIMKVYILQIFQAAGLVPMQFWHGNSPISGVPSSFSAFSLNLWSEVNGRPIIITERIIFHIIMKYLCQNVISQLCQVTLKFLRTICDDGVIQAGFLVKLTFGWQRMP